uniref:NAC domain-containing protein 35-like n=1 Tax=Erigeron canadensis TaxID=72917 RepID=UPI001CB9A0F0|nr:NAC domain-containing protein 35-like [Erigeron canadensis]
MAIGARMMNQEDQEIRNERQQEDHQGNDEDDHENDMVMPGFRFHPTEEELIEFYLRRKVEGKRFNVELITFLDLYRYDPWELPALAAIGEKEWFFYVPRDRKYRNGDRPNRVTTSGYWKATGADRMIRTDNLKSIGLKKTLVFYSGKAPKGIRSSWIMNEYRLPQHEFERLQKPEISLCRVYKRTGVEDRPCLPRTLQTTRNTSSFNCFHQGQSSSSHDDKEKISDSRVVASASNIVATSLGTPTSSPIINTSYNNIIEGGSSLTSFPSSINNLHTTLSSSHQALVNNCPPSQQLLNIQNYHQLINVSSNSYSTPNMSANNILYPEHEQTPSMHVNALNAPNHHLPGAVHQGTFAERLWEWNSMASTEGSKDFIDPFK